MARALEVLSRRLDAVRAAGLGLDNVRIMVSRARAWLDPDGVEPAERDRHGERALRLWERDGGCAMCHLPPGMTKAHHIRWWARDHGPTDIDNGVLLCESCHRRIHDNGWDVRTAPPGRGIRGGRVWFTPPACVDPTRQPRLGGRARYDYTPAA